MARVVDRLPENASGELFVDRSCIDCDTCRQLAPGTFGRLRVREQSYVHRQPETAEERRLALMALVSCPTASIGSNPQPGDGPRPDLGPALASLPVRITGEIYYCGFAAESSYGASSYLLRRPEGNLLVDSPRAARPLIRQLEALGGVRHMFLTHRDDVADHQAFARHFGCERILHAGDLAAGTRGVERKIEGEEPVRLADDLLVIPVPGHTRGSMALLHQRPGSDPREACLFTGDHLWWAPAETDAPEGGGLHASPEVCWYSWEEQTWSMRRLLDLDFGWVLPGHGRRFQAATPAAMKEELGRLIAWMQQQVANRP